MTNVFEEEDIRYARGLGDYHLRSALTKVPLSRLRRNQGRQREIKCFNEISEYFTVIGTYDPGRLLGNIMKIACSSDSKELRHRKILFELIDTERRGLGFLNNDDDPLQKSLSLLKGGIVQSKYTRMKERFQLALMYLCAITSDREMSIGTKEFENLFHFKMLIVNHFHFILFGDLIGVCSDRRILDAGLTSLISLDCFRMIVDKLTERDNILLASNIGFEIFPEIYPHAYSVEGLFSLLDDVLVRFGNEGYKFLKTFEALITGVILARERSLYVDTSEFLHSTIENLEDQFKPYANILVQFVRDQEKTVHHLTQFLGLFRLWGHPEVDPKAGMEKTRKIGTLSKFISLNTVKESGRKFKEIICLNYFKQKGVYPNVIMDSHPESYLLTQIADNSPFNIRDPGYTRVDWDFVSFGETFVSPKTFNLSMIVSDTAISPTRKESLFAYKSGKPATNPMIRRGVLKWMKDGMVDCEQLLHDINDEVLGLNVDDRIIGLYPKEREMNPVPRMFALMSLRMRSYVVVTENMLSDNILPLIPGITMTHSMLDLQKEMVKNTKSQIRVADDSVTFCLNMDFEKWNLNMRKESTYSVFESLGQLFGFPTLYNKTYDIFENSIVYLADGSYVLKIDDELEIIETDPNLAYTKHLGGFEGLRQKGWTIFTVVLIALVCDNLGIKYRLMGQGDNQVLIVTIYSHNARVFGIDSGPAIEEITNTLISLQNQLQEIFGSVGLPLKPLESWTSESFFSYGKFPIYRGVPCAMSLKKISRIFFFSNEDLMTIDNAMGSITSNAQSSVMADIHPVVSYIIAKWQHICCVKIFMVYHPLIGGSIRRSKNGISFKFKNFKGESETFKSPHRLDSDLLIKLIVTVPKTLGGYNSVNYFDMIMRGFTDPVTKDMSFLTLMYLNSFGQFQVALGRWKKVVLNDVVDYVHLVQDPTSLNLFVPPNSKTIVKRMIVETVQGLNLESEFAKWFFQVLSISDSDKIRELCECLAGTDEVNVRFVHDFLGATLYGYSDSITSKVDKTVTLSRMTLGGHQKDVVGALCNGEYRFWDYFEWRTSIDSGLELNTDCPNEYVKLVRDIGWKKKIVAVYTPFPFHYLSSDSYMTDRPDSFIEGYVSDRVLFDSSTLLLECGNSLPYLGSITKEKIFSPVPRIAFGTEPLITRPLRLLRAIGWFIQEFSHWAESIKRLLQSVTNLDPTELIYVPEHIKGSMAHRYSDMATKHGSLWMPLFGPPTHFHISTNSFSEFSKGTKNVTLHFQATLCLIQYSLLNMSLSSRKMKVTRYYKSCAHCIKPVDEDFPDLREPISSSLFPSCKENPYLFVDSKDIFYKHGREIHLKDKIKSLNFKALSMDELLTRCLLEEIIGTQLATSIMYGDSSSSSVFDLQNTSRTLFLKIDLRNTLFIAAQVCFLIMSESERDRDIFPSWKYLFNRFMRRIQSCSPENFLTIGGFFCWKDVLQNLKSYSWAYLPQTYPISVSGVSQACKQTTIGFFRSINDLEFKGTGILPCYIINNVSWLAKIKCLERSQRRKTDCYICWRDMIKTPLKFENQVFDVRSLKCKADHSLYLDHELQVCSLYEGNTDALIDLLPNYQWPRETDFSAPELFIDPLPGENLLTSLDVKYLHDSRCRPMRNQVILKSAFTEEGLCMKWRYPTLSAYRIYDLINACPELYGDGGLLILGDGFGLSSIVAKLCFPSRKIYSWTLIDITSSLPHSLSMSEPPTHYFLDLDIDASATIEERSDIRDPNFPDSLSSYCSSKGITSCISEIEIWYSGASPEEYIHVIKDFWNAKINVACIKIIMKNIFDIEPFIIESVKYYESWRAFATESCKVSIGTCWLVMKGRKRIPFEFKYLPRNSLIDLEQRMIYQMTHGLTGAPMNYINRWFYLESVLWTTKLKNMTHNYLNNWFCVENLMGWDEENFTLLFYNIKTGRRPKIVRDAQGNSAYYLYKSNEMSLFVKLMSLALSQIQDLEKILDIFNDENTQWGLSWKVSGIEGDSRLDRHWHPELVHVETPQFWNDQTKKEIFHHIPMIQLFRDQIESLYKPEMIRKCISFKYIPFHMMKDTKILCFPISKSSSFKMGKQNINL